MVLPRGHLIVAWVDGGGEFWTDGYYVATVGERGNWRAVKRYVQGQGKDVGELRQLSLF